MKRLSSIRKAVGLCSVAALMLAAGIGISPADAQILRAPKNGEVRALVIGIDAYKFVRPLKGAAADAKDIEESLRKMGVKDLTTLLDDKAERGAILAAFDRLTQRAKPGDLVVISLAGHGAQEPEKVKGSQPDGMDTIFLLPGFQINGPGTAQRIIGTEFNKLIKQIEARGANVLFISDTCHAGGMTREIDPRAEEMSFRQVARYTLTNDQLKPISTTADAFLTELDFEHTAFLAAVDRATKSPEVHIPGITGWRGALSYAAARAFEGRADADNDGKVTLKELFTNVRQVVYQLSDQRQNMVTANSPNRDTDHEVAFQFTRSVVVSDATPAPEAPPSAPMQAAARSANPVRIASLDGKRLTLADIETREAPFEVVLPGQTPDLVWDPATHDVLAGGDVIAYKVEKADLPGIIDRMAATRDFKQLAARRPQPIRLAPNDKLHHRDARLQVEVSETKERSLIMFNLAGDGTVQALYPIGSDPSVLLTPEYHFPVQVREPYGADQVVAITSDRRMPELEQALKQLNQRRSAVQMLKAVERYAPPGARIGTTGIFTAR